MHESPSHDLPLPPPELRERVGPVDAADYDNPEGNPILQHFGIEGDEYSAVFDFGCGCGRQARQLLQQKRRPERYVGIDLQRPAIEWCQQHLTPVDPRFQFVHHDVFSPWYAPENSLSLAQPFPVESSSFSLIIATSVFTHLTKQQTEYYLTEVSRILRDDGIAYTTWLFFDRASFSFANVSCLYTSEVDINQAVVFDRGWFLATVRQLGLAVRLTRPPAFPGHQWNVLLVKRTLDAVDRFPLDADAAEWVCGATLKPMASTITDAALAAKHDRSGDVVPLSLPVAPPALHGALAELDRMKRSNAWAIGRAITSPVRLLKRWL